MKELEEESDEVNITIDHVRSVFVFFQKEFGNDVTEEVLKEFGVKYLEGLAPKHYKEVFKKVLEKLGLW